MNAFMRQFLVIIAVLVATANACNAVADGFRDGGRIGLSSEVADRDKTGTSPALKKEPGSQVLENKPNASRGSFEAEGMGLSRAAFRNSLIDISLRRKFRHFNKF